MNEFWNEFVCKVFIRVSFARSCEYVYGRVYPFLELSCQLGCLVIGIQRRESDYVVHLANDSCFCYYKLERIVHIANLVFYALVPQDVLVIARSNAKIQPNTLFQFFSHFIV